MDCDIRVFVLEVGVGYWGIWRKERTGLNSRTGKDRRNRLNRITVLNQTSASQSSKTDQVRFNDILPTLFTIVAGILARTM